tara:strand:- start:1815 stop:2288 length:474 start_codon:yes stop_codon:yes gene_type:complete
MSKETKTQVWANVQKSVLELITENKVTKKFSDELLNILEANIAPKSGGGNMMNPPKDIDGVIHYYCRFHKEYYPEDKMVMSNEKSKGYCKASISLWNKTNSNIKKLDSEAVNAMEAGDFDKAQKIAKESKLLKDNFNKSEFYDKERDWANFNKPAKA